MYLTILDEVTLRFHGQQTDIIEYMKRDYGLFQVEKNEVENVDINVQFVEETSNENESVHIREPIAYDSEGVFFHPSGSWSVMRVDFDAIGNGTCNVTCDVNFNRYLMGKIIENIIHFYLLDSGKALCHSSAFRYNNKVVVCPAWRNVGKTNLLLSLLEDGAEYIADDLSVIQEDGSVYSIPKRLNLLHYNFKEYPHLLEETSQEFQGLWDFVERARSGEFGLSDDEIQVLTSQARMRISPFDAFNQEPTREAMPIDAFCLLRKVNSDACPITRSPLDGKELVHRMYATMEFEMSYFLLGYRAHKAQMGGINQYIENAKARHLEIYQGATDSTENIQTIYVPSQDKSNEVKREIEAAIR